MITEDTDLYDLEGVLEKTVLNIKEYEAKIGESREKTFYSTVNLTKVARKFDDGSYKIYGRDQSANSTEVIKQILTIVLESDDPFDYSDIGSLYKIEFTLDSSVLVPFNEYEIKYGDEAVMEIQEYIYENQSFYANLDKEGVDKIIQLISTFSTAEHIY
jgi:hypothetical protein